MINWVLDTGKGGGSRQFSYKIETDLNRSSANGIFLTGNTKEVIVLVFHRFVGMVQVNFTYKVCGNLICCHS